MANLQRIGVTVSVANAAEDLGIATTGGRSRAGATTAKRIAKASARAKRATMLYKATKGASNKLYATGVNPQQHYGVQAHGATPSNITAMRRNMTDVAGGTPNGCCTRAWVAAAYPNSNDPEVYCATQQIAAWHDLWAGLDGPTAKRVIRVWNTTLQAVATTPQRNRWRKVKGPLGATMVTASGLGWAPLSPCRWEHPGDGLTVELGQAPNTKHLLQQAVERQANQKVWKQAATHYRGKWLEEGQPWVALTREVRTWLRKKGYDYEANLVPHIVAGALWDGERLKDATPSYDPAPDVRCPTCGEPDTLHHRYWDCEGLLQHDNRWVRESNNLARVAATNTHHECLWYRGLTPYGEWGQQPQPLSNEECVLLATHHGDQELFQDDGATFGTDGGGGPDSIRPEIRQVTAALAAAKAGGDVKWATIGLNTPGRQTVPRAEAWALCHLLEVRDGRNTTVWVDASYVVRGVRAHGTSSQAGYQSGPNGDIWCQLYDQLATLKNQGNNCTVLKIKSHLTWDEAASKGVPGLGWLANALADKRATLEEARVQHPSEVIERFQGVRARGFDAIRRLAFLEAEFRANRKQEVKVPAVFVTSAPPNEGSTANDYRQAVNEQGHHLRPHGKRVTCTRCRRSKGHSFSGWDTMPCGAIPEAPGRSLPDKGCKQPTKRPRLAGTDVGTFELGSDPEDEVPPEVAKRIKKRRREDIVANSTICSQAIKRQRTAAASNSSTWHHWDNTVTDANGDHTPIPEGHPWLKAHPTTCSCNLQGTSSPAPNVGGFQEGCLGAGSAPSAARKSTPPTREDSKPYSATAHRTRRDLCGATNSPPTGTPRGPCRATPREPALSSHPPKVRPASVPTPWPTSRKGKKEGPKGKPKIGQERSTENDTPGASSPEHSAGE